jgi:hypothetical protein
VFSLWAGLLAGLRAWLLICLLLDPQLLVMTSASAYLRVVTNQLKAVVNVIFSTPNFSGYIFVFIYDGI